MQSNTNMF